jgi:5-formyltetrahydrofolate cyclo-ligase
VVVPTCWSCPASAQRRRPPLGYGGGYYDRWLYAHPDATAIGVAWSFARIDPATFAARPHDVALTLIVTEQGVR